MISFKLLTNRPDKSRVHHKGHISIHFYSQNAPVVSVKLDGNTLGYSSATSAGNNLYILNIPSSVFQNGKKLNIIINGSRKDISIVKRACKFYTIAWLNPIGGIDHYTFYADKEESNKISKEKILPNSGYKVISSYYDHNITAFSDYETSEMLSWIAEIYSSPKTWLLDNGSIIPIDIISTEPITLSSGLSPVEIEFRMSKPVILQQL